MNKFAYIILLILFSMAGCYSISQTPQTEDYTNAPNGELSYQTFYDDLQPYGNWIDYPGYGYVWQPNEEAGFAPYQTNGHWVSTVDGWAWASNYNWGWAPFHYGRWLNEPSIGWAWVPGLDWAPAWVTWGQYNNNYAWAPLAPGINISFGNTWRAPANYWSYVPRNCINYPNLNRYVNRMNNTTVVNNITIINNYNSYNQRDYFQRGPDYRQVEQYTHKQITPVAIAPISRPGRNQVQNNRQFQVYRPAIAVNAAANSAPSRIVRMNEVRNRDNVQPTMLPAANDRGFDIRSQNNAGASTNPLRTENSTINRPYNNRRNDNPTNSTPGMQTQQPVNTPASNPVINNAPVHVNQTRERTMQSTEPVDNNNHIQQIRPAREDRQRSFPPAGNIAPVQSQPRVINNNNAQRVQEVRREPAQQQVRQPQQQPVLQKSAQSQAPRQQRPPRTKM